MSRPAKMVLKAACARRRTLPRAAVATPPATEAKKEKGLALPAAGVLWGRSAMGESPAVAGPVGRGAGGALQPGSRDFREGRFSKSHLFALSLGHLGVHFAWFTASNNSG